jgi:hypothetical protein
MRYNPAKVRRLGSILFNALTVLSLILFVAMVVLWVRSYREPSDRVVLKPEPDERAIFARSGTLYLIAEDNWPDIDDLTWGTEYERTALGFGTSGHITRRWKLDPGIVTSGYLRRWHMPLWSACLVFALLPSVRLSRTLLRNRRPRPGLCQKCGYDLRATPERCPECGTIPAR